MPPGPGPHQLAASSGASLQRFGGRVQAGLPPALGTFKEAELWGGRGRHLRSGQSGHSLAPLTALSPLILFSLFPSEGFQNTPGQDDDDKYSPSLRSSLVSLTTGHLIGEGALEQTAWVGRQEAMLCDPAAVNTLLWASANLL